VGVYGLPDVATIDAVLDRVTAAQKNGRRSMPGPAPAGPMQPGTFQ
jgi:hypothetical protein